MKFGYIMIILFNFDSCQKRKKISQFVYKTLRERIQISSEQRKARHSLSSALLKFPGKAILLSPLMIDTFFSVVFAAYRFSGNPDLDYNDVLDNKLLPSHFAEIPGNLLKL